MRDGRIIQIGTPADILLTPADAYVAEFTEDVAFGRVIRAGDLAQASEVPEGATEVSADDPLDRLLGQIATGSTGFRVAASERRPGGVLTREAVLSVMNRTSGRVA